ncbi:hypothetical protein HYT57_03505 [Candidatus Woesearchaeota archaeon]|nr:hypothetical protein [Candidatus Woesearchaeota archaeon]
MKKVGKAYGFFGCSASRQEIEAELSLPAVRRNVPKELELSLMEDMNHLMGLSGVINVDGLLQFARRFDAQYMVEATYPDATNEKTSGELQALLINLSNSLFCHTPEHIQGKVVYEVGGRYVIKE